MGKARPGVVRFPGPQIKFNISAVDLLSETKEVPGPFEFNLGNEWNTKIENVLNSSKPFLFDAEKLPLVMTDAEWPLRRAQFSIPFPFMGFSIHFPVGASSFRAPH